MPGLGSLVVFEGKDAAGKGGVIKRITERVSPRVFRVVALPAPSGEVVIFDRSWYNRAGVERVTGFCTDEEYERFLKVCPAWERDFIDAGVTLIKYWFEISQEEQTRRFSERINDPRKTGSLAPWTWSHTAAGMITPGPGMQCSRQQTLHGHPGMLLTQMTSGGHA
jgi:polyphosphate kinase 2 (PPK2 family)